MQRAADHQPKHGAGGLPFRSPLNHSVVGRFRQVAGRYPDRLAASDLARSYSYADLSDAADRIASAIVASTTGLPGPVAILLPNDARYAAALCAVLAARRGCLPLDIDHPIERNRMIATHAGIAAIVTSGDGRELAQTLAAGRWPIIDTDRPSGKGLAPTTLATAPDDLAYIIYTSGSTGAPKGVFQNHRGLLHDIEGSIETLTLTPEDRLAMFSSPSLVHGMRVCFGALLSGASVHMLRPRDLGAEGLAREVLRRGITVWRSVPQLFAQAAEALPNGERFDSLRLVYLGGDRVGWSDYDLFRRSCGPHAEFATHLGSTECSTVNLQWIVDAGCRGTGISLPVGRPIPDRVVHLLDEEGRPVAGGEVGEFVVSSRHLALGYWNDPELTARSFSVDPADPDVRSFRTGDLGRRRTDGLYEFVGRADHQVKINGHRVEPGETEGVLRSFSGVRDAAIVVRRNAHGEPRSLVAYVELGPGSKGMQPRHLMALARKALPRFMVPDAIIIEPQLPRLRSLKVDRVRLHERDQQRGTGPSERVPGSLVDQVAGVFEHAIGVSGAVPDDTIASLGGDSLHAIRIIVALEQRFGLTNLEEHLAETRTIREAAEWIEGNLPRG